MTHQQSIKIIGSNGQFSLGKAFAGKMVLIDRIQEDTWVIKSGAFIPDSEKWLHQEAHAAKIEKALVWAKKNKPRDNLNQVLRKLEHGSD